MTKCDNYRRQHMFSSINSPHTHRSKHYIQHILNEQTTDRLSEQYFLDNRLKVVPVTDQIY